MQQCIHAHGSAVVGSVRYERLPPNTGIARATPVEVTGILTNGDVVEASAIVPKCAYTDSCVLIPDCTGGHRTFTDCSVSVASGVGSERSVAKRVVKWPGGVAHERSFTIGIVVVPGGVAPERLTAGGRVVAADIINERLKTDGGVEGAGCVVFERCTTNCCVGNAGGVANERIIAEERVGAIEIASFSACRTRSRRQRKTGEHEQRERGVSNVRYSFHVYVFQLFLFLGEIAEIE